ncbi:MAG: transketolase [Planctomycetota bacterium]|jgi:transketolase
MTSIMASQAQLVANTIRSLAMDAVQEANSGHPGMPMGMADAAATLWLKHLRYSPEDPEWAGRDRFVLSAGHGSMLLYSLLHLAGFDLSLEEIKNFRQLDSKTPGHPEYAHTPGVETTTGPLGQGFANGVGMALGAKMEAARFSNPGLCTRVFGIVSDGDLMEGISAESASLAGHLGLSNLVYLYDDNRITIDGSTDLSFSEDVKARFEACGWRVSQADGHDQESIAAALDEAVAEDQKPCLIICRTHIGFGSPNKVDSAGAHGAPLGVEEIALTKQALGIPAEEFFVPEEVRAIFKTAASEKEAERKAWLENQQSWASANEELAVEHRVFRAGQVPGDLLNELAEVVAGKDGATRALSGKIVQRAAFLVPSLVGGSADLNGSTKTDIETSSHIARGEYSGRNLCFGIREHAMAAILNGLALQGGFVPIGSTFLVFADYMRPSIRLAALMKLRVGFVFTHDSLMVGEDGPTHQPVEQVASLRLIPNLHVFRPADAVEVAAAWTHLLSRTDGPVALSLTRQGLPCLDRAKDFAAEQVLRGGYVLSEPSGTASANLIATGSELSLAMQAAELLAQKGIHLRVISMPCVELFNLQDESYRQTVLPTKVPTFAVEMGRPEMWCQFTGSLDRVMGHRRFGASAPYKVLAEHFGFTPTALAEFVRAQLA